MALYNSKPVVIDATTTSGFAGAGAASLTAGTYDASTSQPGSLSQQLHVSALETLESLPGVVAGNQTRVSYSLRALIASRTASHRWAASIAMPDKVTASAAMVGSDTSLCSTANAAAGGQCGLRCHLGDLAQAAETIAFNVSVPAEGLAMETARAQICACLDDGAGGVLVHYHHHYHYHHHHLYSLSLMYSL